ncbi:MAG: tetratricopeptide repeat protein [Candidatus Aegiribacteria sp.]|nr:tetratricopeptide repeat protein [Candidatus Aegiribacteria sp.]
MKNLIPYFISEQFKNNSFSGTFKAYTMLVDISGFTQLTETLMIHRKDGAEVLTDVLNIIFNPIVRNIYGNKGLISTYAGDAFTAIFRIEPETANYTIIDSALYINKYFINNTIIETRYGKFELGVKVGLSYGEVNWGIIGGSGKYTYYFRGEAIEGCTKSEHSARKGEIVLDDKIFKQLNIDNKHLADNGNGYFILSSEYEDYRSEKLKSFSHEFARMELQPFIYDPVLNFKGKAEFREVVCVFISFDQFKKESLIDGFVIELIEESYKHGGYFNKIDFGDEDGVALVLFGAPISYENNIERALNFILQIRNNITKLRFKAGITCGTVYAGIMGGQERCEYTAIGDIVNLSSRYMMRTEWNKFWVGENIAKKVTGIYDFKEAGDFKFKGKTGKIPVFELIKKMRSSEAVLFEGEIVGRKTELKLLKKFSEPVLKNEFAGITYVHGEAGIGKSRLVWEFKKQVNDAVSWFYFPCEDILRKSFHPIIYFIREHFDISEENSKEQNRQNFESQYYELISNLHSNNTAESHEEIVSELVRTKTVIGGYCGIEFGDSLYSQLDAKARYENFLYAVKNLIKAESVIKPVIIEFDDTHWIDSDTEQFIRILTRNIDDYPILLICTARFNDDGSEFELDLDREAKINKIDLGFLSRDNISEYARFVLNTDNPLSAELLDFTYEKTNGNPFFAEQLLLSMNESNLIRVNKNSELYSDEKEIMDIPSNIQAVVISRLDRLSDDIKEVVQTASVLGREFLIKILTNILKDMMSFDEKLDFIEKEKIWLALSEVKYTFKHALLRDAAYDMQLRSRLKKLHKFAAESFEEVFKDDVRKYYGDIAYHYEKAEIENRSIEYMEKAGDYSKENFQNKEAIEIYSTLLNKYKLSNVDYIDISLKKGEVLKFIGKSNEAEKILRLSLKKAEEISNKNYIARCCNSLGGELQITGNYDEARKLYERALGLSKSIDDEAGVSKSFLKIGSACMNLGDYTKSMECFRKSLKIFEKSGNKDGISSAVGNMGIIYKYQGNYDKAMELYKKQYEICEDIDSKIGLSISIGNMGIIYWNQGKSTKAMECFDKKISICKELGYTRGMSIAVGNKGMIYLSLGDHQNAIECFKKSMAICEEHGDTRGMSNAVGNMGIIYLNLGNHQKAIECFLKSMAICEEHGDKRGICIAAGNMGVVFTEEQEFVKAEEYFDKAISIGRELNIKYYLCEYLHKKAELLFRMNDPDAGAVNNEALKISLEIDRKSTSFVSRILKEKIDFKASDCAQRMIESIENLKSILKDEKDDGNVAELNYEIALMLSRMNIDCSMYKNDGISFYKKLYKKTPNIEFRNRYEELVKLD